MAHPYGQGVYINDAYNYAKDGFSYFYTFLLQFPARSEMDSYNSNRIYSSSLR